MNKRGSHVGIILSFVIFITFLVFLYSVIEPITKIEKEKQSILDYLEVELLERFSADLTTTTILVNGDITENCITIKEISNETISNGNLIVKDDSENILIHKFQTADLQIDSTGNFFKIYHSEEFKPAESAISDACQKIYKEGINPADPANYSIGLTRTKEYLFESRINETINKHKNSYEELKKELNVLAGTEFGFSFFDRNRNVIFETEQKNITANAYVKEVLVQYIDEKANIIPGFINIKVW